MAKPKTGRPVSLTPEAITAIGLLVEAGASPAAAVGTLYDRSVSYRWLKRGEDALIYVQEHAETIQPGPDGLLHHPEPDEDLFLTFFRQVGRAGATAYASAEERLKDRTPMDWLSGPVGRSVAMLIGAPVYVKRAEVEVNVLTVGTVVDQAFQVLEGDGVPVAKLGPLGKLKELRPPLLGEDNGSSQYGETG